MAKKGKKAARTAEPGNVSAYAARQQAAREAASLADDSRDVEGPSKKREHSSDTAVEVSSKKKRRKGNRHPKSQSGPEQPPASTAQSDDEGTRSIDAEPVGTTVVKQSKKEVTISLGDCPVTFVGQYNLRVGAGAVSVYGAVLHASSTIHQVYAPSTHSLPVIRPLRDPHRPADDQPIEFTISSTQNGMRSLKEVSAMFGRIWNKAIVVSDDDTHQVACSPPSLDRFKPSFTLVQTAEDDGYKRSLSLLERPDDWQRLLTTLASRHKATPRITALVCGPKGSGKSTFTRMLVNAFITKKPSKKTPSHVALLDVDPGQPEYSPPGEVSLVKVTSCNFAPPFCHPIPSTHGLRLIHSHHVGATSPTDDPGYYMRCVSDLFQHYHQVLAEDPSCPLIVNTGGWIQGKGLEILCSFISQLEPTDVIYTSTQGPPEVTESITQATSKGGHNLHLISSQPIVATSRTAADLRLMQTLSYFHLKEPEKGLLGWDETPTDYMDTLQLRYAGPEQEIYGVQLVGAELDPEFLIDVLEGCIVGLVVVEEALPSAPGLQTATEEEDDFSMMDLDTDLDMVQTPKPKPGRTRSQGSDSPTKMSSHLTPRIRASAAADYAAPPSTPIGQDIPYPATPYFTAPDQPRSSPTTPKPHTPYDTTSNHNLSPPLPRTPEEIPYYPSIAHVTPPLDPATSYSLGQGLIRSVDTASHIFHLITPVPRSTIDSIRSLQKKLVLVRGKLETPGWSYLEDHHHKMRQDKKDVKAGRNAGEWGREDTEMWTTGRNWVRVGGWEKWEQKKKVRHDLGKPKKP
ncbi:MAG: hypothetical protein Q9169_001599 [Polycauliona sp. 2 TL-2023]